MNTHVLTILLTRSIRSVAYRFLILIHGIISISVVMALTLASQVRANPGALDPTFGVNGKVTTDFTNNVDQAYAVALQPDGKILVAGSANVLGVTCFAVARYFPNGTLDTAFGNLSGRSVFAFTDSSYKPYVSVAHAVAIQSDGKIVLAGYIEPVNDYPADSHQQFALLRFNSNGSLDTSFGTNGKVTVTFGSTSSDVANGVAIQTDGKIVAAGSTCPNPAYVNEDFALVRFRTDGSLDTSFGVGGKVITSFRSSTDRAFGLAIQADGRIVAVGSSDGGVNGLGDFALARYQSDGSLDQSFGVGGKVLTDFAGYNDYAMAIAIQKDGKLVAAGGTYQWTNMYSAFALARYNPDGSLDATFGNGGKIASAMNGTTDERAQAVAVQNGGQIVAAGYCTNGSGSAFAIQRFNPGGDLDLTFGNGGKVQTAFSGNTAEVSGIAIQSDGKIIAAGSANPGQTSLDFALARYESSFWIRIVVP